MPLDRLDNSGESGLRRALRGWTVQLAVPQGSILSVGGTLAAVIGLHGLPDLLDVWLFAVGAAASLCMLAVVGERGLSEDSARPVPLSRAVMLNLLPVLVIPAAVGCAALVPSRPLGFLVAGALAAGLYGVLLSLAAGSWARREE